MSSFLWNVLFAEVTISCLLLALLSYYFLFKKKEVLSLETFEKIKESRKLTKIASVLLLLSFFLFIIHEASEITPYVFGITDEQKDLLFIRHVVIYLPLIPFQAIVLSLIVRALRRT